MIKRSILCLLVLCLIAGFFSVLPVAAGADYIPHLSYSLDPVTEGGEIETGALTDKKIFSRTPTIIYSADLWTLTVNGTLAEGGSVRLETAGEYELVIESLEGEPRRLTYLVLVKPVINVSVDQVFTSYPTIICENALSMVLDSGNIELKREIASGETIKTLGRHSITVYGVSPSGAPIMVADYNFFIKGCDAKRVYDKALGKQAIEINVGSFEDVTVEVTFDGTPLAAGKHTVTTVGRHALEVKLNGVVVTDEFKAPSPDALNLIVSLKIDELETDDSIYLDLTGWDVTFLLDGKEVKDYHRITGHGTHTLMLVDANGQQLKGVLEVFVGDAEEPIAVDELVMTFHNPHMTYGMVLIAVAALLALGAVIFLLKRRKVV